MTFSSDLMLLVSLVPLWFEVLHFICWRDGTDYDRGVVGAFARCCFRVSYDVAVILIADIIKNNSYHSSIVACLLFASSTAAAQ